MNEIYCHESIFGCTGKNIEYVEERKIGFISKFSLKCNMCGSSFVLNSCEEKKEEMSLNESFVSAVIAIGSGFSGLEELSAIVGIPCISKRKYNKCQEKVYDWWEKTKIKSMEEAAQEEARLAIDDGCVDKDGIPMITVVADGCWAKRSYKTNYSSLSGAAAIVGHRTGKILYMGVKNKYCMMCARANTKKSPPSEHRCFKNYNGSSSGMESTTIVEGFKNSISMYGLIYSKLIADGDSSTYRKILECRPYANITVEKVECRNHLLRNYCSKLYTLASDTSFPIAVRKILKQNVKRLRVAVTSAIKFRISENNTFEEKICNLSKDIINSPRHVFGDHLKCDLYFCKNSNSDKNHTGDFISCNLFPKILYHCSRLANNARSLIYNLDSNIAETFNSIIAKFIGGKRINFTGRQSYSGRCAAAVVAFNSKAPHSTLSKVIFDKSPIISIQHLEQRKIISKSLKKKYVKKHSEHITVSLEDAEYGESCQRPDMDEGTFSKAKEDFLNILTLSTAERMTIEKNTRLQSDSGEWLEKRRNLLTASWFGKVCKRRLGISCGALVNSMLYSPSLCHVPSIKYGKVNEFAAIRQLELQNNIKIHRCGLFIDSTHYFLGATPDGTFDEDNIVEIKCPSSASNMTVDEAIEKRKVTFWKRDKNKIIKINKNHDWYFQIQGQLHVANKNMCLFAVWTGTDFQMKTENIYRDDKFWNEKMFKKLESFYMDCLLPELIDPRKTRSMDIKDPIHILKAIENKAHERKQFKKNK